MSTGMMDQFRRATTSFRQAALGIAMRQVVPRVADQGCQSGDLSPERADHAINPFKRVML